MTTGGIVAPARLLSASGLLLLVIAVAPAAAQDAAQVQAGRMVWSDAGCSGCHGANGQGGTSPDLPNGPSLHSTKLDRKGLVDVISCGRPGTQMAAWLKGAYTMTQCGSAPLGAPPPDIVVVGAYSAADINALVDYLYQFVKLNRRQRIELRNKVERLGELFDWKELVKNYDRAHEMALERLAQRTGRVELRRV